MRTLKRREGLAVAVGNDSWLSRSAKAVGIREVAVISVAIFLALLSSWGYYVKSLEVNELHSRLVIFETQSVEQSNALAELDVLLTELKAQIILEEEQFEGITSALRQEIEALKWRPPGLETTGATNSSSALSGRIAYLTFDDGPLNATPKILEVLKEHEVKATFFVNGRENDYALRTYKRIVAEGHAIGNHTYSHEYDKVYSSVSGFISEVEELQKLVSETTGVTPEILRFPAGSDNRVSYQFSGKNLMPSLTRVVQAMGIQYIDWNVTSASASSSATMESIYDHVIAGCEGRDMVNILFHETEAVALALPAIIEELKQQGYSFAVLTRTSPSMQFLR